jgi:TMEM175 potassium channel family protein
MADNDQAPAVELGEAPAVEFREAERLKFFTDAVVAIAMTLLILPLMESVTSAAEKGVEAPQYVNEHGGQLFSFVLSFVIIANFWTVHERLYQHVERYNGLLMWLNVAWMLTIVFLPVPTAMVGEMDTEWLQEVLYIGTMLLNALIQLSVQLVVRHEPRLRAPDRPLPTGGLAAAIATVILFGLALGLALAIPGLGYFALFALFLTGPLQHVFARLLERR